MSKFVTFVLIAVSIVGLSLIAFRCMRAIETIALQTPTDFALDALPRYHIGQEVAHHGLAGFLVGPCDRGAARRLVLDRFNVLLAMSFNNLSGNAFRFGHLGYHQRCHQWSVRWRFEARARPSPMTQGVSMSRADI